VLEQMPADSIEKIEVITNPSAKYKPDGTAGIINITLKRTHDPGYSGSIRANVGNDSRYNVSLSGNYRPGKYNISGLVSVRQDDRLRYSNDVRTHLDAATNTIVSTNQSVVEHTRPLSRLAQLGADYSPDKNDKVDLSLEYNLRTFFRTSTTTNLSRDATGMVTSDYDRLRVDPEWQKTQSVDGSWQHSFADEGHEFSIDVKRERHWEQEDNHYTDVYRTPLTPTTFDTTLIKPTETTSEIAAAYSRPLKDDAKLESGYTEDFDVYDTDYRGGYFDPIANAWLIDLTRTNRFIYKDYIHALYGTYGRAFGKFGFLTGLRLEETSIDTDQVTSQLVDHSSYLRIHPSLHLTYNLSDESQLQLNYSHRIHRPESDDLNPFPEYQDPFNLRAGNPRLKPAETHSIETGYQYRKDDTTYLVALYFRDTYHSFTQVTRYIDSTTLLTTQENLATSQSGGLELTATRSIGPVTVNFSGNAYRNQIDASNLGLSSSRSTLTWDAKLNASYRVSKTTQIQLNSNYTATRLTAQGERRPTYITNLGLKHDFPDKKTSLIFTVSDVFNSLKERTIIDTPTLHDDTTRRRSSRIVYVGFIYNFGKTSKKAKDDGLKFDNSL
jgi:outer membrane receptor protein involved in Fe transport